MNEGAQNKLLWLARSRYGRLLAIIVTGLSLWLLLDTAMSEARANTPPDIDGQAAVVPVPPFSPFGTVQDGGVNVPVGTNVRAYCDGIEVEFVVMTTAILNGGDGKTWYSLEIPADNDETPDVKEGCSLSDDTVYFMIGDRPAAETITWKEQDSSRHNLNVARPMIEVEKYANDLEADSAPGLELAPGDPITWTFAISNTGNVTITNVVISDSNGTTLDVTDDYEVCTVSLLPVGQSASCPDYKSTAIEGLFANRATAEGFFETLVIGPSSIIPESESVAHQDWSFYTGIDEQFIYLPFVSNK